jgi:hypothetical protein
MTNDDSEIANISCKSACKYILFLQDFANFKTFLREKKTPKKYKRMEQIRRR